MGNQRNTTKRSDHSETLGLAAIGSAGGWEVAIDEPTSAESRWFAQIEGPSVYLSFEVDSPRVIDRVIEFPMQPKRVRNGTHGLASPGNGELVIGKSRGESVTLVRDDEFPDRCFLIAEVGRKLTVRVTIGGKDLELLESALRQAKGDLDEDASD
jgi:hypothetical protein